MQLSTSQIDSLMHLWSASLVNSSMSPPFHNHWDMYNTIDCTTFGDIPWSSFSLQYNSEKPTDSVLAWMDTSYEICYRDPRAVIHRMLANPDFKDYMDYVPYCEYDPKTLERCWQDFMSGDWAWQQAVSHFISISFQLTIHLYDI